MRIYLEPVSLYTQAGGEKERFSKIFKRFSEDFQRFSKIFKDFQRFSKIFKDFQRFSKIFKDFQRCSKIFKDFARFSKLLQYFQIGKQNTWIIFCNLDYFSESVENFLKYLYNGKNLDQWTTEAIDKCQNKVNLFCCAELYEIIQFIGSVLVGANILLRRILEILHFCTRDFNCSQSFQLWELLVSNLQPLC